MTRPLTVLGLLKVAEDLLGPETTRHAVTLLTDLAAASDRSGHPRTGRAHPAGGWAGACDDPHGRAPAHEAETGAADDVPATDLRPGHLGTVVVVTGPGGTLTGTLTGFTHLLEQPTRVTLTGPDGAPVDVAVTDGTRIRVP